MPSVQLGLIVFQLDTIVFFLHTLFFILQRTVKKSTLLDQEKVNYCSYLKIFEDKEVDTRTVHGQFHINLI